MNKRIGYLSVGAVAVAIASAVVLAGEPSIDADKIAAEMAKYQAMAADLVERGLANQAGNEAVNQAAYDLKADADRALDNLPERVKISPDGGAIDFDQIVKAAAPKYREVASGEPQFLVFASLSMPKEALKQLIIDTGKAGGVVVFRGFPNNKVKDFTNALGKILGDDLAQAPLVVDPRLFRAFNVQAAPVFVMVTKPLDLCEGFDCVSIPPPHDRLSGNVSVAFVLDRFADGGGQAAPLAKIALAKFNQAKGGG